MLYQVKLGILVVKIEKLIYSTSIFIIPMGEIIGSKVRHDGKVVFNVMLSQEEALNLQGHIDNVRVFSDNTLDIKTNLSERGSNRSTKYFLIPSHLRKGIFIHNNVACQRLNAGNKIIFVYLIDKLEL